MDGDFFRELTWGDLVVWAGKDIVTVGRNFQLEGRVKKISTTDTGGLLAWVDEEDLYVTRVESDSAEIISECTCNQNENPCAHAIALIIEFIVCLKRNMNIPTAKSNDRRFFLL
jgi:uncharacterized Zn finger protein